MKVGIIGSRERNKPEDRKEVFNLVSQLDRNDIVVSGGCRGIDSWAIDAARKNNMRTRVFLPIKLDECESYVDMVRAFYSRNREIVDFSDILYAFPSRAGLKGGTQYTVNYASRIGKKVIIK